MSAHRRSRSSDSAAAGGSSTSTAVGVADIVRHLRAIFTTNNQLGGFVALFPVAGAGLGDPGEQLLAGLAQHLIDSNLRTVHAAFEAASGEARGENLEAALASLKLNICKLRPTGGGAAPCADFAFDFQFPPASKLEGHAAAEPYIALLRAVAASSAVSVSCLEQVRKLASAKTLRAFDARIDGCVVNGTGNDSVLERHVPPPGLLSCYDGSFPAVAAGKLLVLYGESGVGKTVAALQLAARDGVGIYFVSYLSLECSLCWQHSGGRGRSATSLSRMCFCVRWRSRCRCRCRPPSA